MDTSGRKGSDMNIFSLFTLCGGLAFFLYGMTVMSKSLEKMAGGKLERLLKRMTSNPIKSLLLGAGITIAIQSSSAMTVMLVGLVNSGVMEIGQTIGIIMGSNIGTTLTAWLLSLTCPASKARTSLSTSSSPKISPPCWLSSVFCSLWAPSGSAAGTWAG